MKINLSDSVKVQLTSSGMLILQNYCDRSYFPAETWGFITMDKLRYCCMPLKMLLRIFGHDVWCESVSVFENDEIIIDE